MRILVLLVAALVAACSPTRKPEPPAQPEAAPPAPSVTPTPAPAPSMIPALTLDGYKRAFALRVTQASPDVFTDPLPEVLRSIVVVDVHVDREGKLLRAAVARSNGIKALEAKALDAVRRAAPYQAPAFTLRRGDGSVQFLETFLFRDDGRFQVRTLVASQ